MTFAQLLARYESGAIASQEFAVESLIHLDPRDPAPILREIPPEIVPRLREFLEEYRPGQMVASQPGPIPSPDQVEAAREWLENSAAGRPRLTTV